MKIVIEPEEALKIIAAELERRGVKVEGLKTKIHQSYDECEFQGFEADIAEPEPEKSPRQSSHEPHVPWPADMAMEAQSRARRG